MKTNFLGRNVLPRAWVILLKFKMLLIITLISFNANMYGQSGETCLTGKHIPRTAPNLLDAINGQFTQAESDWKHYKDWYSYNGAYPLWSSLSGYDENPGCIKLTGPNSDSEGDKIRLENFPIEGDKIHTISLRCKTEKTCHTPIMYIYITGKSTTTGKNVTRHYWFGAGDAEVWEEFSFPFKMPLDVESVSIQISNHVSETENDEDMVAYIDDIYLGLGRGFDDAPSCKVPFDGQTTRVDELGNVEVRDSMNNWIPFFPVVIHGDTYRDIDTNGGWEVYSEKGFNAIIMGGDDNYVDKAIDAGLKVAPHLGFYYARKNADGSYGHFSIDYLKDRLNHIKNNHSMSDLLYYFIDNEVFERWDQMKTVTDAVMAWEGVNTTDGYERSAPICIVNGNPHVAPKYLNYDDNNDKKVCHVGDITSTYIQGKDAANWRFQVLDHQKNQRMPANIAQINGDFIVRARLYGAIANGARGMDFWRDFAPGHPDYIPNCYDSSGNPIPNCPNPTIESHQHLFDHLNDGEDSDGDGTLDIAQMTNNNNEEEDDNDTNNNGIIDIAETHFDTDGDDYPDIVDADKDDDGEKDFNVRDNNNNGIIDAADASVLIKYDYNKDCVIDADDFVDVNPADGVIDLYYSRVDYNGDGILDAYQIDDDDQDGQIEGDVLNKYYDFDCGNTPQPNEFKLTKDITLVPWWDTFDELLGEITSHNMMQLIRQPHWTYPWKISSCDVNGLNCDDANIVYGTRELKNKGYLIVANYGDEPVSIDFRIAGLPFSSSQMTLINTVDVTDETPSTNIEDQKFSIYLPVGGAGVYRIEEPITGYSSDVCANDINITVDGNLANLYQASESIETESITNVLPNTSASLKAGKKIILKPGFKASCMSKFRAYIEPCEEIVECVACLGLPNHANNKFSEESKSDILIKHYPSPFREEVTFEFSLDSDADTEIVIVDVHGKTIMTTPSKHINQGLQTIQLSTKNWIPGVYFYQLNIKAQHTGILSHANGTLVKM